MGRATDVSFMIEDTTSRLRVWATPASCAGAQALHCTAGTAIDDNVFHHVVLTYDTSIWRAYVDGVQDCTGTGVTGTLADAVGYNTLIGYYNGGAAYAIGFIDDVHISAVARSAAWIAAEYRAGSRAFVTVSSEQLSTAAVVTDKAKPVLLTKETQDLDNDGSLDAAYLTFSEAVSDASVQASDFDVSGVTGEAFSSTTNGDTANDADFYVTFADSVHHSGITPTIAYTASGATDLEDRAAVPNAAANISAVALTDKAKPVLLAATATGASLFNLAGEGLDLVFSEPVSGAPTEANLEAALTFEIGAT